MKVKLFHIYCLRLIIISNLSSLSAPSTGCPPLWINTRTPASHWEVEAHNLSTLFFHLNSLQPTFVFNWISSLTTLSGMRPCFHSLLSHKEGLQPQRNITRCTNSIWFKHAMDRLSHTLPCQSVEEVKEKWGAGVQSTVENENILLWVLQGASQSQVAVSELSVSCHGAVMTENLSVSQWYSTQNLQFLEKLTTCCKLAIQQIPIVT